MPSRVTATPTAPSDVAAEHFARRLSLETDCDDVHGAMLEGAPDFVLLDVRGPGAYARAHVPGALNLPQRGITAERMAAWPEGTVFVVYCAGPHCNGADKAALALARLGRPAKVMIGGMTGWADEGFASAHGAEAGEVGRGGGGLIPAWRAFAWAARRPIQVRIRGRTHPMDGTATTATMARSNDAAAQLQARYGEMRPHGLFPLWEVLQGW